MKREHFIDTSVLPEGCVLYSPLTQDCTKNLINDTELHIVNASNMVWDDQTNMYKFTIASGKSPVAYFDVDFNLSEIDDEWTIFGIIRDDSYSGNNTYLYLGYDTSTSFKPCLNAGMMRSSGQIQTRVGSAAWRNDFKRMYQHTTGTTLYDNGTSTSPDCPLNWNDANGYGKRVNIGQYRGSGYAFYMSDVFAFNRFLTKDEIDKIMSEL